MHLAQINIAKWSIPPERATFFFDNLERVNEIAASSPNFVWRFTVPQDGDHEAFQEWDEAGFIINASVWETPEALEHFVWNTVHKRVYERKEEWFEAPSEMRFVMWWVEPGHIPSLAEAKAKLEHLNAHGDTDEAFGWAHLPQTQLWKKQQCG